MLGAAMRGFARAGALWALLAVAAAAARAGSSPWSAHEVLRVRLVEGVPAADGQRRLGLHYVLDPGWHVYWRYPGDAGAAPQVAVLAAGGGTAVPAKVRFPAPHRFALPGGLEALGYEHEVVYPVGVTAPAAAPLRASVDYVACAVECIPFHDDLALKGDGADAGDEALLASWEARLPLPVADVRDLATRLEYTRGSDPRITLEVSGAPLDGAAPELFLEPPDGIDLGSPRASRSGRSATFTADVRPATIGAAPASLPVTWTLTGLRRGEREMAVEGQALVAASASSAPSRSARAATDAATSLPRSSGLLLVVLGAILPWSAALPAALASSRFRALGVAAPFLAAVALVGIARALVSWLPSASLAIVEVSWLVVALGARSASIVGGKRRWAWVAFALAAGLAAWRLVP